MPQKRSHPERLKRQSFQVIGSAIADAMAASLAIIRTSQNRNEALAQVQTVFLTMAKPIADELSRSNPAFDRSRFLAPLAIVKFANEEFTVKGVSATDKGGETDVTDVIEGNAKKLDPSETTK